MGGKAVNFTHRRVVSHRIKMILVLRITLSLEGDFDF